MIKGMISKLRLRMREGSSGESIASILGYFWPEFITSFIISALPLLVDANFISHLKSTSMYGAQGIGNNSLHLFSKLAESFSVGAVILIGYFNGLHQYKKTGRVLQDAFWLTLFFGLITSCALFMGAHVLLYWLNASPEIIQFGVPFLRIRAIGVFFWFISLAFIGFLRGIKNTRTPMYIFVIGAILFIIFDYCLIFGACGLPAMGLKGSAYASVIQNIIMAVAALCFVLFDDRYKKYGIELLASIKEPGYFKELMILIWPVTIDKATMAIAYMWLSKMINPMGTCVTASFCVIKDLERFAFLPAIAMAQIITFLVSNDYGIHNWAGIQANIKKIILLTSVMVFSILTVFTLFSASLLRIFDKSGDFTDLALKVFPFLSVLVFFDLLQLILSGALRGAGDVKVVMYTRLAICLGYFVPVSYLLSGVQMADPALKFLLIYGSFYVGNALMSIVYIYRFSSSKWKKLTV